MANDKPTKTTKKVSTDNRRHYKYRSEECLNCGQPLDLSDIYCPYCSQLNSTKPLSIKDFINEFLGSVINYDSRFRHTIKDLLFHPGRITKRYINGQRQRYANPFRFFLSVSIVYFLLSGFANNFTTNDDQLKDFKKGWDSNAPIKDTLVSQSDTLKVTSKTFPRYTEKQLGKMDFFNSKEKRIQMYIDFYKKYTIKDSRTAMDSLHHNPTKMNLWLYGRTNAIDNIFKKPQGFLTYIFGKIPFFLFFLAPIYALFFLLLYKRSKNKYVEHLIFIFHIFTFLFLGMLIAMLPDLIIGQDIFAALLFLIVGPFYLYKALRNYYGQGRFKTILKFVLLNFAFSIVTALAISIFLIGTAAIY